MTWILIVINLTAWNGHYVDQYEIGKYTTEGRCMQEIVLQNTGRSNHYKRFICVEDVDGSNKSTS